jgi:poly(3-hydroxyalkanoate) synthetase
VQQKLREIKNATGQNEITLINHSMGGLVATHAATSLHGEDDPKVPLIITLGSPMEGTHLAKIAPGQCARDMQVDSDFVKDLRKRLDNAEGIRFVHFSSTSDEIIHPQSSARPENKNGEYVLCPNMGHLGYLLSPKVVKEILRVLPKEV